MRTAISLAIALSLAGPSRADAAADPFPETVVELRLNGAPDPHTLVVRIDRDGALLIRSDDLEPLRLRTPARGLVLVDGERYYRFADGDGTRLVHDTATQSIDLTLPSAAFVETRGDARAAPVLVPPAVSTGAFVNYDLSHEQTRDSSLSGAFLEGGLFGAQGVVTGTVLARDSDDEREAVRLDTTWTRDFPDRLATLHVGDTITATGAWGRAARIGGVQFGTNFATQPTLVTTPLLSAQGEAIVPSTVDVFVNGQRVAGQSVPPGPFTIDNVPAVNGAGQMQVVVTDALGRQQVISQPYYSGSALLQKGLDEYSIEAGAIRENYTSRSFDYGQFAASGTWRRGLTDGLTAEGHLEATEDGTHAFGADLAFRIGHIGIVSTTAAHGGNDDGDGWLGGVAVSSSGPRISVFASTRWMSESFAQIGSSSLVQKPKQRSFGGLGLNLRQYGALQFAYGVQQSWNGPRAETIGLSYSLTLQRYGFLNLFANQDRSRGGGTEAQLSWTIPFGERRTASTTLRHGTDARGRDEFEAVATLQQNLPAGVGSGYQVSASTQDDYRLAYAYQGRAGQANLEYASRDGEDGWRVGVLGGLAITAAGAMPSRSIEQSFAVVKIADFEGVPVFVQNQLVGRTDSHGRVLVEGLRAYESNEIGVDASAMPMDASLARASISISPAWRSGALVVFPATRMHAVTFRLQQEDGQPVPAGAEVSTAAEQVPVAFDGVVYLEQAQGQQAGEVVWNAGRCNFDFVRPATEEAIPDLGNVTCRTVMR